MPREPFDVVEEPNVQSSAADAIDRIANSWVRCALGRTRAIPDQQSEVEQVVTHITATQIVRR